MFDNLHFRGGCALALLALAGCGNASTAPDTATKLTIVASSGSLSGVAGDAISLKVMDDGKALPAGATITWSGVTNVAALDPSSMAASPLPAAGAAPTGAFVTNAGRPDGKTEIDDLLFILDAGTKAGGKLSVTATVAGSVTGTVTAAIDVAATPAGTATAGAATYAANCAVCHGATAHGTDAGPNGMFTYAGGSYSFPAPGLNTETGNLGGDPGWNAALLAMAARSDMDNGGLTLREPMPNWLDSPNDATGKPLATQDYADIYAFLKTQSH